MKVFVYKKYDRENYAKRSSKKIAVIENVVSMKHDKDRVTFLCEDGSEMSFNVKTYKTTTYTN